MNGLSHRIVHFFSRSWVFRWILVQAKRWFLPVELKDLPAHGDKKGNESQKKVKRLARLEVK